MTNSSQISPASRLVLGSSSPYRQELLARLGLPFQVCKPDIDESPRAGEAPEATALRLAREKAQAVARQNPDSLVIGSDQVATLDGMQIGKPGTHDKALRQLQAMRGRRVVFHTALCLLDARAGADASTDAQAAAGERSAEDMQLACVPTFVTFRDLADAELDAYLRIEQPYDCAGSAKNEGLGIALLEKIESEDPTALTGLPLIALTTMLRRAGVAFFRT